MPFQAKITRQRFYVGPFSAEQMFEIARVTKDAVADRIKQAINVNDAQAKPLKPGRNGRRGYPDYKIARGRAPIRDWVWRGKTMRSLQVKSASEDRAVIGFVNAESDKIAHINNLREKQFGISPNDRKALNKAVLQTLRQARIIRVRKTA